MTYKLTFQNYPQMTCFFEKECGYTVDEITGIAIRKMLPGMTAVIELAGEKVKEIQK